MEYIHYGHDRFDKGMFDAIKNIPSFTKPNGGLWGSRKNSEYGWKYWCEESNFHIDLEKSFEFSLKDGSRLLTIDSCEKLLNLPRTKIQSNAFLPTFLDFERLSENYDAIEVLISEDGYLYRELYGWDCDSILVMNPDVIIQEK